MTTVHATYVGDQAMLPREDLDRLLSIARRVEDIQVNVDDDGLPAAGLAQLAQEGKAFAWLESEPDLYSIQDLKVRYR